MSKKLINSHVRVDKVHVFGSELIGMKTDVYEEIPNQKINNKYNIKLLIDLLKFLYFSKMPN